MVTPSSTERPPDPEVDEHLRQPGGQCFDLGRFESIWDAIEDTTAVAENMKIRSSLMMQLKDYVEREGLNQSQAARLFGVTQPRVSDLMRGKIDLFAIDTLVNMLAAAGMHVEVRVAQAA